VSFNIQNRKIRSFYCAKAVNLCYFREKEANLTQRMKIYLLVLNFSWLSSLAGYSQNADSLPSQPIRAKNRSIAFGIYLPAGSFSGSHTGGVGLDYSWGRHLHSRHTSPDKLIGLMINGGANYYLGKKIQAAGYDFRYGGYINLYALSGLIYTPIKKGNLALAAGPALNIYKGAANAAMAIKLMGNYLFSENIAIGPAITCMKHKNTKALWAIAARASYAF
jgi:hypothetical protein